MCVQIGNPLFWIAYCVLRKGRRIGHDSIALCAHKVKVSNGIHIGSFVAAVEGVDRHERLREITRECVRLGKKFWAQHGRRGGWQRRRVVASYGPRWRPFCGGCRGGTGRSACMRDVREFHERLCEIGKGILGASRQTGWRAEAARVAARAGHRPRWRPLCGG